MSSEKMITDRWLDKHDACNAGSNWFRSRFPQGAEISQVLIGIACDPEAAKTWGGWLMTRAKYANLEWIGKLPESIGGSLCLGGFTLPEGLKLPESIGGSLYLGGCTLPEGLKLPESIGGSLYLGGCTLPEGLKLPESIGGSLYLGGCTGVKNVNIPTSIKYKILR